MKMPRSQCETENVQFVQELAEVDGPFESPININFNDLTKLELPSLVWNRGDTCPKKMKITNTGHTVILSGKWKCERPYLTGGPLTGKYVFSQIHFHWGREDCRGSEHQVCGEEFPLEMHVTHFKTEYLTQECALREKDGMVVVVYLFKLQDEPNQSLKKIINCLPCVKQASTSHAVDPKPILSLCNPFTDDYFMYWGSVVTSSCAHILLWIICREPFGISRDQVNEFRKLMDQCQQPICRNNRDIQPLHKRNVFHVNASKCLDEPLLPIKKIMGCFCQKDDKDNVHSQQSNNCSCKSSWPTQEDVEGSIVEYTSGKRCTGTGDIHLDATLPGECFKHQTFYVQRATTVHSVSALLKRIGSEPLGYKRGIEQSKPQKSDGHAQLKLVSQSCCFFPTIEIHDIKTETRKNREIKKPFHSIRAFSQILQSLEALKNHTFKKLREIDSINQEIKGMRPFCQDQEDRQWLRKLEKIMKRQKRVTIKSSQGCFSELKKLAKDCNLDRFFESKAFSMGDNNEKILWIYNDRFKNVNVPRPDTRVKEQEVPIQKTLSKHLNVGKAIKFSTKAQKIIQSFFEDIQENEDLNKAVRKDLTLKKIKSINSKQAGDANSVVGENKNYITQNMFILGNLGDRFFTEVTVEDFDEPKKSSESSKSTEKIISEEVEKMKIITENESDKITKKERRFGENVGKNKAETLPTIPLRRANIAVVLSRTSVEAQETPETYLYPDVSDVEKPWEILSETEIILKKDKQAKPVKKSERTQPKYGCAKEKDIYELTRRNLMKALEAKIELGNLRRSTSNLSTESTETHKMIIAKLRRRPPKKEFWERNSSGILGITSKELYEKKSFKEFEGYYIQKKSPKNKKRKKQKGEKLIRKSSSSREETKINIKKTKWKSLTKAKIKLEIKNTSGSSLDSSFENSIISPERKKLRLECQKVKSQMPEENIKLHSVDKEIRGVSKTDHEKEEENNLIPFKKENFEECKEQTFLVETPTKTISRRGSRSSTNKTYRPKSAESKASYVIERETNWISSRKDNDSARTDFSIVSVPKPLFKNKSFTCLMNTPRISLEIPQRIYLESIDDRRRTNKQTVEFKKALEGVKKLEEKEKTPADQDSLRAASIETKSDKESENRGSDSIKKKYELQSSIKVGYNVGYFTTTSSQVDEELLPKSQIQEEKGINSMLKRCDAEKYRFLEKRTQELDSSLQDHNEEQIKRTSNEKLFQTDSNKSFSKDASKGDAEVLNSASKDLQTTLSFLNVKKNSTSRPHSAETLNSLTKTTKRKSKKRPHCCKRNSKHYIRKNSSTLKKLGKTESKQINFLNLTDQEQLKIISVNVAKYLKRKLVEENNGFESDAAEIKEVMLSQLPRKKTGETEEKEPSTPKEETPPVKPKEKEKKEEKQNLPESKAKTKTAKTPSEPKKENQATAAANATSASATPPNAAAAAAAAAGPTRPAYNFIKLNKLMAGKYKRPSVSEERKPDEKTVGKAQTDPQKKSSTKFKTKIPKKKKEKPPDVKVSEQPPNMPGTAKGEKQSPSPKAKKKNPQPKKKADSEKNKPSTDASAPSANAKKKSTENPEELADFKIEKIPQSKKLFVPTYTLTSYLPSPFEIVEIQQRKMNRYLPGSCNPNLDCWLPELLYDTQNKVMEKSDTLFKKELEYFIRLQMCLNNDCSTNYENSMSYLKPSQDFFGPSCIENSIGHELAMMDSFSRGIVLSSSTLSINDEPGKNDQVTVEAIKEKKEESEKKNKLPEVKSSKESGDPGIVTPPQPVREGQEEANSDSSYDCKISITLNPHSTTDTDSSLKVKEEKLESLKVNDSKIPIYDQLSCPEQSLYSQTTTCYEGSSSHSILSKLHRKKRKDNDISFEMKQKLLEILEGEIKREVGIKCGGSSENSSEGFISKWDDSDVNNKSQSTESSYDNMEVLTQISDTMRQYLKELKENGQLVERIHESSDKESKEDAT